MDKVIKKVITNIGDVDQVYLVGELAMGRSSKVMDLWFVGCSIDKEYLMSLVSKAEKLVKRKIRYMVLDEKEKVEFLEEKHRDELILVWESK